jgi:hypothetical protein
MWGNELVTPPSMGDWSKKFNGLAVEKFRRNKHSFSTAYPLTFVRGNILAWKKKTPIYGGL